MCPEPMGYCNSTAVYSSAVYISAVHSSEAVPFLSSATHVASEGARPRTDNRFSGA